jgi:glutamine amidotransferase
MAPAIAVLDYGIGNLRSAEKALQHLGADACLVSDPDEAVRARAMVLPGVGAFGPCAQALRASGLGEAVRHALDTSTPFLGICIGFQLLFEGSDEAPGTDGIGVLPGVVRALPAGVKRPQMQWNRLDQRRGQASTMLEGLPADSWAYFVHSYAPDDGPDVVATCDYGGPVVAAAERGPLWGAQFHPEKSGTVGLAMLGNFVRAAERSGAGTR